LVLETTFESNAGKAVLRDTMALGPTNRGHELGADAPHALLRSVTCLEGQMEFEMEYAPRAEYGLVSPLLIPAKDGVLGRGGSSVLLLSTAIKIELQENIGKSQFILKKDETISAALQHRASWEASAEHWNQQEITRRIEQTINSWQSWSRLHQNYDGPHRELVLQSGRVLQGLTYFPTGAMVAAATTSLPEAVGGSRNWDYRYSWVRDSSFTLNALWVAACPDEAHKFFDFLACAALTQIRRGAHLQIMFGIGGEHDLTEREIPYLSGWRNSRPVRIGNGAWNQRQIDVYGELLDAAYVVRERLQELDPRTQEFLVGVAEGAASHWKEKDQGIWEIRSEPRHFLYSKLMCWVALDRAIKIAALISAEDHVPRWKQMREEICQAILKQGWSEQARAFTQSFGSNDLDASNLMIPIVGFLPPRDPRVLSTIDETMRHLTDDNGLVFRYRAEDGLSGEEGTFLLCTFWLAHALAMAGRLEEAEQVLSRGAAYANDVGLLAEEVEPGTKELLGNFPQAFSHIGLINAAWAIAQAQSSAQLKEAAK
jgi:alpha,alpha-trehalase